MSTNSTTGARVRPPREGRSNGQWLVDGLEPLNHNEEFKAADNGLNVRERIEQIYSKQGFASIEHDDLHGGHHGERRRRADGDLPRADGNYQHQRRVELRDHHSGLRHKPDGD